mmetsp:Transcript_5109/g.12556  ORF Transcript_5109/g.12556 Transcript_5109/m.12556 type:complete len:113 (+) Transcript_5109:84-422(+)
MRAALCCVVLVAALPVTEKVTIDGTEVVSQGAGDGALSKSRTFSKGSTKKVCVQGQGLKATVYLRNRSESYHKYQQEVGSCDPKSDSTAEHCADETTHGWMKHAQSYTITPC